MGKIYDKIFGKVGDFDKAQREYYKNKYLSQSGIFNLLIQTPIFWWMIVTYNEFIKNFYLGIFSVFEIMIPFLGIGSALKWYVSLIALGMTYVPISRLLTKINKFIFTNLRKFINGKR